MATILRRKTGKGLRWTVHVRRAGRTILSRTFGSSAAAKDWERGVEHALDRAIASEPFDRDAWLRIDPTATAILDHLQHGAPADPDTLPDPSPHWTLRHALEHYDDTVTETLEGWRQARARIKMWQADALTDRRLAELTPEELARWISGRTKAKRVQGPDGKIHIQRVQVAASTVRNDVYRLSALYEHARAPTTRGGWGLTGLTNPVPAVQLPPLAAGRQRRLDHQEQDGEEERLLTALAAGLDGPEMVDFIVLALETGMRRSELLDIRAGQVRSTRLGRVIERPTSKSGEPRRIILSDRATDVIDRRRKGKDAKGRLFTLNGDAIGWRWDKAREAAGCRDLRLHDIRHEAASALADAGLSVGALAAQTGHKTMQTLLRYVNASERDVREKLARKNG